MSGQPDQEYIYSISEMAKIHEISRQTLIYYDRIGLFAPAWVNPENGYRYYTLDQCPLLREIRLLVTLNVPLAEIKAYLHERDLPQMKALLSTQLSKTHRRLQELAETEKILRLRLANLEKLSTVSAAPATEPSSFTLETKPRRYYVFHPYPGTPTIRDSSLLFRQLIGFFRSVLQGDLFRKYYHELKFKHGQLLLRNNCVDSSRPFTGCGAVVYTNDGIFRQMKEELAHRGIDLPHSHIRTLPAGVYAVSRYTGSLCQAAGAALQLRDLLHKGDYRVAGDFLFSAILEPPFILDSEQQTYEIQVRTGNHSGAAGSMPQQGN